MAGGEPVTVSQQISEAEEGKRRILHHCRIIHVAGSASNSKSAG
jgi:hypothetical protein